MYTQIKDVLIGIMLSALFYFIKSMAISKLEKAVTLAPESAEPEAEYFKAYSFLAGVKRSVDGKPKHDHSKYDRVSMIVPRSYKRLQPLYILANWTPVMFTRCFYLGTEEPMVFKTKPSGSLLEPHFRLKNPGDPLIFGDRIVDKALENIRLGPATAFTGYVFPHEVTASGVEIWRGTSVSVFAKDQTLLLALPSTETSSQHENLLADLCRLVRHTQKIESHEPGTKPDSFYLIDITDTKDSDFYSILESGLNADAAVVLRIYLALLIKPELHSTLQVESQDLLKKKAAALSFVERQKLASFMYNDILVSTPEVNLVDIISTLINLEKALVSGTTALEANFSPFMWLKTLSKSESALRLNPLSSYPALGISAGVEVRN
ncbi:hypothetical protein HDE_00455 [Halotydeus destructor]|nr:hypothetical protein HDE_00455 [Halotydeus destructor]